MIQLSDEQLNNLDKEALIIIVSSLQDQLASMQSQLDSANAQLVDTNRQLEIFAEQLRLMNQRHFEKRSESASEIDGQLSMFDSLDEVEATHNPSVTEPEITEVIISSYKRSKRKGKQEADLDGLPARIFEHKLSEEELAKKFPDGYKDLPEKVYKRLHVIPETFIVDEHMSTPMFPKITADRSKKPKDQLICSATVSQLRRSLPLSSTASTLTLFL